MKKQKVIPILFDTYIAIVKNSIDSNMFRNFYAEVNGKKTDIAENGNLSCAWFVSSIACQFKLIKNPHLTINGTINDLKDSGWKNIKELKIGSILVWEEGNFGNGNFHKHIGFYVGNDKAVSNSSLLKYPTEHHVTFGFKKNKPIRKIEAIFWNKKLNQ